jgi:hypothetical protein
MFLRGTKGICGSANASLFRQNPSFLLKALLIRQYGDAAGLGLRGSHLPRHARASA